jgi:hypothetical protein
VRRLLKIVLLWLIALAVPIQGAAAATMVLCGPIHQRIAIVSQVEAATTHGTHDQHKSHHHVSADAKASGHHDSQKDMSELPTGKYSCSACAACCSSTAISGPAYLVPDLIFVSNNPVAAEASPFSGFVPEGPEHPPRSILV